jgi:Ca2+-binding RTX toxin-like protein
MRRALRLFTVLAVAALASAAVGAQARPLTRHAVARAAAVNTVAPFGCRASTLRLDLGGTPVEPTVANSATYPCKTDSHGVSTVSVPNGSQGPVNAGPVGAFTYSTGSAGGTVSPGAAATASVKGVVIPTSSGIITIAGPVEADASYECVNDKTVGVAQSTLQVVDVNGSPTKLPTPGASTTINLGGGAYIAVNEKLTTPTSLTERVLDIHLANGTDIVVGEALVTQNGTNACTGTSGPPPVLEICPPGSTLEVVQQQCVIFYNGGTIYVSRPFKGPTGGTVIALGAARKKYHSPCLSGPGPNYALVATKRGGRVQGTPYSDRILALGAYERVAALGGNDCVDGKGGHQHLFDGNGKDRVWSSAGFNRVAVGNGNDYVNGRNGSDWITAGNGNDTVYGGQGNSRIDLGLGHDHVYGGKGKNRIWTGAHRTYVNCGSGKNNTAFVRAGAAPYAKAHGCRHVHILG